MIETMLNFWLCAFRSRRLSGLDVENNVHHLIIYIPPLLKNLPLDKSIADSPNFICKKKKFKKDFLILDFDKSF